MRKSYEAYNCFEQYLLRFNDNISIKNRISMWYICNIIWLYKIIIPRHGGRNHKDKLRSKIYVRTNKNIHPEWKSNPQPPMFRRPHNIRLAATLAPSKILITLFNL